MSQEEGLGVYLVMSDVWVRRQNVPDTQISQESKWKGKETKAFYSLQFNKIKNTGHILCLLHNKKHDITVEIHFFSSLN